MASEDITRGPSPLSRLVGTGDRPLKVVPFPGPRGEESGENVGLWSLLDHEVRESRIEALKFVLDTMKLTERALAYDEGILDEEKKYQLLFRAMRDPAAPMRAFAGSVNELRTFLTPDEREALFAAYLEFVDSRSPMKRFQSAAEVDELISVLGKASTGGITLSSYDTASLRSIVRVLVDRLTTQTRPLSSDTSPPSDSSPLSKLAPTGE